MKPLFSKKSELPLKRLWTDFLNYPSLLTVPLLYKQPSPLVINNESWGDYDDTRWE